MRKAYISLITNEKYLPGVLVLGQSLKMTGTAIPLVVLLPNGIEQSVTAALEKHNIQFQFYAEDRTGPKGTGYWQSTMAKLRVFDLTEYSKIVFLDADMMILKSLDWLFDMPHMSAVAAGKELHAEWTRMNSGLMVIEPKKEMHDKMRSLGLNMQKEAISKGESFGDQDVINAFFGGWSSQREKHLPPTFNTMLGYGGVQMKRGIISGIDDISVYHFTGSQKPWGPVCDRIAVVLKILKRSPVPKVDYAIYREYRKLLKKVNTLTY